MTRRLGLCGADLGEETEDDAWYVTLLLAILAVKRQRAGLSPDA